MHCFVVSVSLTYALFAPAGQVADGEKDAFYFNRLLGRGINLGNALEAPREGEWGVTLRDEYFQRIKEAGFHSVRIPIRWSAHAKPAAPFTIDDTFFRRIDWAIDQTLSRGLVARMIRVRRSRMASAA